MAAAMPETEKADDIYSSYFDIVKIRCKLVITIAECYINMKEKSVLTGSLLSGVLV